MDKEKALLGSGHLFFAEIEEDGIIPETLFNAENNVGSISGGARLDYNPTIYDVENDDGDTLESYITKEEAKLTSGILNWNLKNIEKLTVGGTYDAVNKTLTIGGKKKVKKYAIGFEHEEDDYLLRVSMIGRATKGVTIDFKKDKETIVDAEFKASKLSNGKYVVIEETDVA